MMQSGNRLCFVAKSKSLVRAGVGAREKHLQRDIDDGCAGEITRTQSE
jgi:hypothetical protein